MLKHPFALGVANYAQFRLLQGNLLNADGLLGQIDLSVLDLHLCDTHRGLLVLQQKLIQREFTDMGRHGAAIPAQTGGRLQLGTEFWLEMGGNIGC